MLFGLQTPKTAQPATASHLPGVTQIDGTQMYKVNAVASGLARLTQLGTVRAQMAVCSN